MHFCTTWLPFWSRTQRRVASVSSLQMEMRSGGGSTWGAGGGAGRVALRQSDADGHATNLLLSGAERTDHPPHHRAANKQPTQPTFKDLRPAPTHLERLLHHTAAVHLQAEGQRLAMDGLRHPRLHLGPAPLQEALHH